MTAFSPTSSPTPATPTPPLSHLEVDLAAVEANLRALRTRLAPGTAVCGIVKKNAYGHGAVMTAHRLVKAGCDMLGVFAPAEAEELGAAAVTAPLLLLYPLRHLSRSEGIFRAAAAGRLHLTVQDRDQLKAVAEIGRTYATRLPLHVYVDTGMSRAGIAPDDLGAVLAEIRDATHLTLAGVMSHLATADDDGARAAEQDASFAAVLTEHADAVGDATVHLANSAGVRRDTALHRQMVRPGLGLYGIGPLDGVPAEELRPALRWVSRVFSAAAYPKGAAVGYGGTHRLRKKTLLGLVPVGYGDGYPLGLSNRAVVRVRAGAGIGEPSAWFDAEVRGRVNMDQISVDLTAAAKALDVTDPGELRGLEVEVYASEPDAPNTVERLAGLAKSHAYELLCRLPRELPRRYGQ